MHLPSFIYLYDGRKTESFNIEKVAQYMRNIFKRSMIQIRNDFINHYLSGLSYRRKEKVVDSLAEGIARTKVRNIGNKKIDFVPLLGEIEYEKRRISDIKKKSFGTLYDGFRLISIFNTLISKEEPGFYHCHIIFDNQLLGTWDEQDLRYHARVSVYGFPSIISTIGIVEAPAKPREFYLKKQMGVDIATLKKEFAGRFIDYDDSRMTEVMKGYVLQAIFYHMTGNPFCNNKNCRFFNAHWQEEVIQAQLNSKNEFCQEHEKIISKMR